MTTVFSMQEELKNKDKFWSSNVAFVNGPKGKRKKKTSPTMIFIATLLAMRGKNPQETAWISNNGTIVNPDMAGCINVKF